MRRLDRQGLALGVTVLLVSAMLRLHGLGWDGFVGAHPDERYIVATAGGLSWPLRLDPFEVAPDYAYGHLPLYALALLGGPGQGGDLLPPARVLSALLDLATVALVGALGRRLWGRETGVLAMALVGLAPLHVQQAHFYTADVWVTALVLAALWGAVGLSDRCHRWAALGCGVAAGLAMGSKFTACLVALPVGAACAALPTERRWRSILIITGAAVAAFALTNPFALLHAPVFGRNLAQQAAVTRGALDAPFTRQFHGTLPYVYPLEQQLRWGMGLLLGLLGVLGLLHAIWTALRREVRPSEWVLLTWTLPGLALWGAMYARFPRYLLPFIPILCIYAARLAFLAPSKAPFGGRHWLPRRRQRSQALLVGLLLFELGLRAGAYAAMLSAPHPWLEASRFLRARAGADDTLIAVEEWDQPLPVDATGFGTVALQVFAEDTREKWTQISAALARADYVVIASQRGYGALARWPSRYPLTTRYYRLLFSGELGFEPVACFERFPRLGPWLVLVDDPADGLGWSLPALCRPQALVLWDLGRLDESFTAYDHPVTIVFGRVAGALSREQIESRILGPG